MKYTSNHISIRERPSEERPGKRIINTEELLATDALGPAKSSIISAAPELGRRRIPVLKRRISHPG